MREPFVHIEQLTIQYAQKKVLDGLLWSIHKGEHWVIGGKSGSGKSTLAKAIAGQITYSGVVEINATHPENKDTVLYVPNWYQFTNLEGDRNFYYQQRYNRHQGKDTLTVEAELQHYARKENLDFADVQPLIDALGFAEQLDAQLIELSSGEHKKLQLVKALWREPQLLMLDEPYTGLDKASRAALNACLDALAAEGVQLILISNDTNLPTAINRFATLVEGKIVEVGGLEDFEHDTIRQHKPLPDFLKTNSSTPYEIVVKLRSVTVRYGEKVVLDNVNWEVRAGEKWLLQGPNGSGKSTLLSLVNGDHPQAYGHDITLFDQKRGTGESIWDIKQKIGLISPEMHWYFDQSATVWHSIASGFYDSIGWFVEVKFEEKKKIDALLDFFELIEVKDRLLHTLPLGQQRLVLLARTIIKNPPLLVLDEPCQGLDKQQTQYFNDVVDEICRYGTTLIYVGHYESELPQCLENKLVLENGKIIARESLLQIT